jgi:hypothetical protein
MFKSIENKQDFYTEYRGGLRGGLMKPAGIFFRMRIIKTPNTGKKNRAGNTISE